MTRRGRHERASLIDCYAAIYPELTHAQQDYVVEQLGAFYRRDGSVLKPLPCPLRRVAGRLPWDSDLRPLAGTEPKRAC